MKKLNLHHFAILPLLTLMATSPMALEKSLPMRGIASEVVISKVKEEIKSEHPRYDEIAGKINREALLKDKAPTKEKISEKISLIKEEIKCLQDSIDEADRQDKIEAVVIDSILIEESIKSLNLDEDMKLVILDIEKLLEPKVDTKPDIAVKVVSQEPKTTVTCEHEEKNIVLTQQVSQLMDDQKKIMDTILGMAQMMVNMFQQQQMNQSPNAFLGSQYGLYGQSPYQYHAPVSAGNWVYYPSGFQPTQNNIFEQPSPAIAPAAPQAFQQQPQPQMQQSPPESAWDWNLRPQMSFQPDPIVGAFGMNPMSFNFQNAI